MILETEILNILVECLEKIINKDTFTIKLNSRKILYYILDEVIGLDKTLILPVCSTLDKLDKLSESEWLSQTMDELTTKGVSALNIEKIINFIKEINVCWKTNFYWSNY